MTNQRTALLNNVRAAIDAADEQIEGYLTTYYDVQADLNKPIEFMRPRVRSDSPNWTREVRATLKRIRREMEQHGTTSVVGVDRCGNRGDSDTGEPGGLVAAVGGRQAGSAPREE